ncbi:MAG: HAD family phosphatase [Bacteroidales bacterium]|nr:HAD family phosphatase [Bacteroidales bacterium]
MRDFATLFDLDGVVFNTENHYTQFWTEIGKKYFPEKKDFASIIKGHSLSDILKDNFSAYKQDWEQIENSLYEMEKNMNCPFIDGVEDFIELIHKEKIPICLVTSSDEIKMKTVLNSLPKMKDYFPQMVIASDIKRAKPSPDCYLLGAKKCNTPVNRCIVFEDSLAGIQAGKSAGMKVIGLSTTNSKEVLQGKVDMIIPDFKTLTLKDIEDVLNLNV